MVVVAMVFAVMVVVKWGRGVTRGMSASFLGKSRGME